MLSRYISSIINNAVKCITLPLILFLSSTFANEIDSVSLNAPPPSPQTELFLSEAEVTAINNALPAMPLLSKAMKTTRHRLLPYLSSPLSIDIFDKQNLAAENQHILFGQNLYDAATLYKLTQETIYFDYILNILNLYANFYVNESAGEREKHKRLFSNIEYEAEWLMHALFALDSIHDKLPNLDRERLHSTLFSPMVNVIEQAFANNVTDDPIVSAWAVSAIGIKALFYHDERLLEKALKGPLLNKHQGYQHLLSTFLSPDGYYRDGPSRAIDFIYPLLRFVEIFHRFKPNDTLLTYRENILHKAYYAIIQTMYPNGHLPTFNTTLNRSIYDDRLVYANSAIYHHYDKSDDLLAIANRQNKVPLNFNALQLALDFHQLDKEPMINWPSIEFSDGPQTPRGGLGILRIDDTMLTMKYGLHGGENGHFDQLSITLFDQGQTVLRDNEQSAQQYQQDSQRYPFTVDTANSYSAQTIAHNTVTVDNMSQNGGSKFIAESVTSRKHFFDNSKEDIQVMSAKANEHYPGVEMQRTTFLIKDQRLTAPAVVDIYRLSSNASHKYDYPVHFQGQILHINKPLESHQHIQIPIGNQYGYQHIWEQARVVSHQAMQLSWLTNNTPYTVTMSATPNSHLIIGRTGANDPLFTLPSKPLVILRSEANNHLFATVLEAHHHHSALKASVNLQPIITNIQVLGSNRAGSAIEITGRKGLHWRLLINNMDSTDGNKRLILADKEFKWKGNYHVEMDSEQEELVSALK